MGAALFRRSNHHIELTEDGMFLKRRAKEILELSEKTQREFASREELTGEIAIGCGETCNMAHLSDLMVAFREQHPLVQFRIYSATADEVKDRMENGLLDMGLLMEPVEVQKYGYPYCSSVVRLYNGIHAVWRIAVFLTQAHIEKRWIYLAFSFFKIAINLHEQSGSYFLVYIAR